MATPPNDEINSLRMRRTRRLPATPVQRLMSEEGWKRFGLIKGPGLPAPIGQYTVGCVDLMHKLEGDNDGLLVRLFYPTTPQIHRAVGAAGSGYQYAKWMPDKRYVKASLVRTGSRFPGFLSTVSSFILGVYSLSELPIFQYATLASYTPHARLLDAAPCSAYYKLSLSLRWDHCSTVLSGYYRAVYTMSMFGNAHYHIGSFCSIFRSSCAGI